MGSAESSEGRRASFGMDEEERVRVLQGIRLSESVVTRMKNSSQPARTGPTAPPPAALGSSRGLDTDCKVSRPECGRGWQPSGAEVGPLRRCEEELATGQGQLPHVAVREGEAALRREEISVDQEKQRSARMARELESREAELRRRDAFYKEQLGGLERKAPQAGARVLGAAGPDPPLLPRPPAGGAAVLGPGQGLPTLCERCPQGLMSSLPPGLVVTWSPEERPVWDHSPQTLLPLTAACPTGHLRCPCA
uniref:MICOS complex subunit MIC25 n=1 Tax=Sus scrofa TaxID=9823 RepID=A0A8D1KBG3_PIG